MHHCHRVYYFQFLHSLQYTVKPPNTGHLQIFKNLSVIKRRLLLGGSSTKIVTFEANHFVRYLRYVRYLGCPLLGSLIVLKIFPLSFQRYISFKLKGFKHYDSKQGVCSRIIVVKFIVPTD